MMMIDAALAAGDVMMGRWIADSSLMCYISYILNSLTLKLLEQFNEFQYLVYAYIMTGKN